MVGWLVVALVPIAYNTGAGFQFQRFLPPFNRCNRKHLHLFASFQLVAMDADTVNCSIKRTMCSCTRKS